MPAPRDARVAAGFAVTASAATLVLAFTAPMFRQADGAMSAAVALPVSASLAFLLLAFSIGTSLAPAIAWLALAIAGFGASLALVDSPPIVAYPHYRLRPGDPVQRAALAVVASQLVLVAWLGREALAHLARSLRAHWRLALPLVVVSAFLGVAPSRTVPAMAGEMALAAGIQLVALLTLLGALRAVTPEAGEALSRGVARLLGPEGEGGPARVDRWVLVVAAASAALAALLAWAVYDLHPHVPDEVVYLLHARYFAQGMLWMPLPDVPAAFHVDLMQYEPTRWYSPVPPGWPAVLALGVAAGAPWLVNPLLAAVAIVLAYLVVGSMYDLRTTRLATLLLATSPWFVFLSMSLMTHTLALTCALAAALGVARARRSGAAWPAFGAGLATGVVSLVRPLEGLATAALLGLWSLAARGRAFRFLPSATLVVGSVIAGYAVRPYNARITGSPSTFPIMAYTDKYYGPGKNDLGFGADRGLVFGGNDPFPGHGAVDVVVNSVFNGFQVNVELLGWPIGAVPLLLLALALGRRGFTRQDAWQLAVIALVVGLHALYWFSGGPDFGARYWYLIVVPCAVLVARALLRLSSGGAAEVAGPPPTARSAVPALAIALCAAAVVVFIPWRGASKYRNYRGMRADVRQLARDAGFGRSLVLVRGRRFPDYASAATYNPVDLHADATVYAWDAGLETRSAVIRAYADRPVWIVDGPTITRGGFRVAAGPMSAADALASRVPVDLAGDEGHAYDPVRPPPPAKAGATR